MLVEDDVRLARLIKEFLEKEKFHVAVEGKGDRAISRILQEVPDLVILDIMLPVTDGLSVCRQVREKFKHPILMLTARGDESDELTGLNAGADDYLAKPVRPQILLARIKALLRRSRRYDVAAGKLVVGPLAIDQTSRTVRIEDEDYDLTASEFELLWLLASHAGEIVSRDQISHALRGFEWNGQDRSIDLAVSRLRKKLGDANRNPERLRSVRGSGYMWVPDE